MHHEQLEKGKSEAREPLQFRLWELRAHQDLKHTTGVS
jgi:hypothetical protein